jgi:maltooligosyltrehalose trehalohydrolase
MSGRSSSLVARWHPTLGAVPDGRRTTFRVCATTPRALALVIEDAQGTPVREVPMSRERGRVFAAHVDGAAGGTRYRYRIDGGTALPDPASRSQPLGVHGPSEVVDWSEFEWTDDGWRGIALDDLVIYELHVGAFTPEGSFDGVARQLPYLAALGINAIELMPIAAFPGRWNWGYDGVSLFAPAAQYGGPAALCRLVDRAHAAGVAVLVDVVYNHLGPDGAYMSAFYPDFFTPRHQSPWGDGVNLDGPGSEQVRRFFIENALHWLHEYHADGLRLDATHALVDDSDRHFLAELSDAVGRLDLGRPVHVIAEDERNLAQLVRPADAGGHGLDAVWADDFHHEMHRLLTDERESYYGDFEGTASQLSTAINRGWTYTGQVSPRTGKPRGTDPDAIRRKRFVFCLQNHDQVGNRARGERITELVDLAPCRAAAAVLLLAPETPLLFMGEEWAASTPFLYFTDHEEALGRQVTEGRRREFSRFSAFSDPEARRRIPDPQSPDTFHASVLRWAEIDEEPHASMRRLYRALIALRRWAPRDEPHRQVAFPYDERALAIVRSNRTSTLAVVVRLAGAGAVTLGRDVAPVDALRLDLTTEDPAFTTRPRSPRIGVTEGGLAIDFAGPCAVVLTNRPR